MKQLWILLFAIPLLAGSYKAKIEPIEKVTISAEKAGRIVTLDQSDELKTVDKTVLVIDHALESEELANDKTKLKLLENQIMIKQRQYNRIKDLKGQSLFTKERYLNELLALKLQREDLKNRIAALEDTIAKKRIDVHGKYLKKLYVRKGAYVGPGAKLMDLEDLSGSRIILYLDAGDLKKVQNAPLFIDGKRDHGYRIEKIARTTDANYISSYRVELVKKGEAPFGKVVTVRIGEER
ncbi:MAG: hypothetical protein B6D59_03060 [Campylobacteraceae bacterium 4484_4]|nr:MAG: hypothetical protein B6D59_03060 [Campylobacteraceae bacterium 4484_4]